MSDLVVIWLFLLCFMVLRLSLRKVVEEETAWGAVCARAALFVGILEYLKWSIWHAPKNFSWSLCIFFVVPMSRMTEEYSHIGQ